MLVIVKYTGKFPDVLHPIGFKTLIETRGSAPSAVPAARCHGGIPTAGAVAPG